MSVWPAYMSALLACSVLVEARRGYHILWSWSFDHCSVWGHVNTENQLGLLESNRRHHPLELKLQVLLIYSRGVMCWEVSCGSLEEQAVLLMTEPSL